MNKTISNLNNFLADLNVLYRKLQNYHWNVSGKRFFVLHEKLEEYYDNVNEQIDEVAEQILMLGGQPLGKMKDYIALSKIQEAENEKISGKKVLEEVLKDFSYMKKSIVAIKKDADEEEVYEVSAMMDGFLGHYSKAIWMISQSMND